LSGRGTLGTEKPSWETRSGIQVYDLGGSRTGTSEVGGTVVNRPKKNVGERATKNTTSRKKGEVQNMVNQEGEGVVIYYPSKSAMKSEKNSKINQDSTAIQVGSR